eukprot:1813588-Amphidinium_carterae.1
MARMAIEHHLEVRCGIHLRSHSVHGCTWLSTSQLRGSAKVRKRLCHRYGSSDRSKYLHVAPQGA